jgi:hypothetical protein
MFSASTDATPTALTVSAARRLAADAPTGATYYRAYENGAEVDRGHTSASRRLWDMESICDHLEAGRRVELRTGSCDGEPLMVLKGIHPRARASI